MKCRITIELRPKAGDPIFGNLTDLSLGGCYVETSAIVAPGTAIKIVFSIDDGKLHADGVVLRIEPGSGVAIQFDEMNRDGRESMYRILEYVQNTSTFYDNNYFKKLLNR
jgi:hypothetical protein